MAYETGEVCAGLETGLMGFSLRGVAPVFYQGHIVGSVETGMVLGRTFLDSLKEDFACDLTIYTPPQDEGQEFSVLASTDRERTHLSPELFARALEEGGSYFKIIKKRDLDLAVLVGAVMDFQGRRVEVLEMSRNRAGALALIRKHAILLGGFALGVLVLSILFVYWVATLFLAPIDVLAEQADRIAAGEQVPEIEITAQDEFGTLAVAINSMLAALEESREALKDHARELEVRVEERTQELVMSEDKFRTLVENIPLAVYRLEPGLIRSFISSHIEKLTGWPPEELVGGPAVWVGVIHPEDRDRVQNAKLKVFEDGLPYEIEYRLQDRHGQEVDVLDHAEPIKDETGRVMWVEGYLVDIRERRRLEEQSIQSEELKTLTEISSRLAHEFRNPLSVVGLCARRLAKNLSESDPSSPHATILIDEVSRLEQILKMIQTYIQPISLTMRETDAGAFLGELLAEAAFVAEQNKIEIEPTLADDLPRINIDPARMKKVLLNLIRNAAYQMPPRGRLAFNVASNGMTVEIKLVYPAGYLPDDQLRHYFFPFTTEDADKSLVDLALTPVIIHRHKGVIKVGREGDDLVSVVIDLPAAES